MRNIENFRNVEPQTQSNSFFFKKKKIVLLSASAADQSRIGENIGERGYHLLLGDDLAAHLLEGDRIFLQLFHPRHQLRRVRLQPPPPPDPVSVERTKRLRREEGDENTDVVRVGGAEVKVEAVLHVGEGVAGAGERRHDVVHRRMVLRPPPARIRRHPDLASVAEDLDAIFAGRLEPARAALIF